MKYFYEKNDYILNHPVNCTFDDILHMTDEQFVQWVRDLRKAVVYAWDELGIPPRMGYSEQEITDQFNELWGYPTHDILEEDVLTGEKDLLRSTSSLGNAVNQFFPTMMKTRINYSKDPNAGKSIYDFFAKDELFDTFLTYARRHFKRDSFYNHSFHVEQNDKSYYGKIPISKTGKEWIEDFEFNKYREKGIYDYFLVPVKEDFEYTGHAEHLRTAKRLEVSNEDLLIIGHVIPWHCKQHVTPKKTNYRIRYYTHGQKLFPVGFKNFRVSFCQYAVNFPPLIAKWVYETFTKEWKGEDTIYVWDPSAGWGGRLLGCLAAKDDRHITYLANDPNTDHNTSPGRTKYHEIYDFYVSHVRKGGLFPVKHNDFRFWQQGSEDMNLTDFAQYRGKLSLVFTSPPYFAKERYSEDETQSCVAYPEYQTWVTEFLHPTLYTAYKYLRPGGYLVWNIADAQFGGDMFPLEKDSCDFLERMGMKFVKKYKMALGSMPGGNRRDVETGIPKAKNFCKTKNGLYLKYEPLYVFQK